MSSIIMTNTDPGEGQSLGADQYLAVYGNNALLDIFYPVGSEYKTYDTDFDPNVSWGGVWTKVRSDENMIVTRIEYIGLYTDEFGLHTVTTNKGTELVVMHRNYGGCMAIMEGAENVRKVHTTHTIVLSSSATADWGYHNLTKDSTVWTYWAGSRSGTADTGGDSFPAEGPATQLGYESYYGSVMANGSGAKSSTVFEVDFIKNVGSTNRWNAQGTGQSRGSATAAQFNSELSCPNGRVPAIYQRGLGGSVQNAQTIFEIYESAIDNVNVWRRTN